MNEEIEQHEFEKMIENLRRQQAELGSALSPSMREARH